MTTRLEPMFPKDAEKFFGKSERTIIKWCHDGTLIAAGCCVVRLAAGNWLIFTPANAELPPRIGVTSKLPLTNEQRHAYRLASYKATQRVCRAVREGKLVNLKRKVVVCVDCKENRARVYDHRDYSKPLEVSPVCDGCNLRRGPAAFGSWALEPT